MTLVYKNPEMVIGKTLEETESLNWYQCYPVVDSQDIITGIQMVSDLVPEELTFDEQNGCYRSLGWETENPGTDREMQVAEFNGHRLEVYEEEGQWCWRVYESDGNADGDIAEDESDAKSRALDAAK
jgi:hypothetical protein